MDSDLPVQITTIPDGFHVAFIRPFQMDTTEIDDELHRVIAARPRVVEIDLSRIQHLSTIGLGTLISLNHRIQGGGGKLRIVKVRKNTLGVIQITKLDQVLEIAPDAVCG